MRRHPRRIPTRSHSAYPIVEGVIRNPWLVAALAVTACQPDLPKYESVDQSVDANSFDDSIGESGTVIPVEESFVVATYNIHHAVGPDGRLDLDRIADVLLSTGAEIVGLQEVDVIFGSRSEFEDQASALATSLNMNHAFGANLDLEPLEAGAPRRQYGTAILTSWTIEESSNTMLPNIGGEPRGLLEAKLLVGERTLRVFNTHLENGNAEERKLQVDAIAERLVSTGETLLLLGDLNATPEASELVPLQAFLEDAWELGGVGPGYTHPAGDPRHRLDYVWIGDDIRVRRVSTIDDETASDHFPLVAELMLAPSIVTGP